MVLLKETTAWLNEQFAGEDFADHHEVTWVESLLVALQTDEHVVEQPSGVTKTSSWPAPTQRDAVTLAVAETDDTHGRMTELFHPRCGTRPP